MVLFARAGKLFNSSFFHASPRPHSFTLVELLVVISIIGLLAALGIPAIQGGLAAARKAEAASQLKQLGTLAVAYTAENNGNFPEEGGEGLQGFSQLRQEPNAWYNVLPPMAGFMAASNYRANPSSFYEKGSLFFLKGAKYPSAKSTAPILPTASTPSFSRRMPRPASST